MRWGYTGFDSEEVSGRSSCGAWARELAQISGEPEHHGRLSWDQGEESAGPEQARVTPELRPEVGTGQVGSQLHSAPLDAG